MIHFLVAHYFVSRNLKMTQMLIGGFAVKQICQVWDHHWHPVESLL